MVSQPISTLAFVPNALSRMLKYRRPILKGCCGKLAEEGGRWMSIGEKDDNTFDRIFGFVDCVDGMLYYLNNRKAPYDYYGPFVVLYLFDFGKPSNLNFHGFCFFGTCRNLYLWIQYTNIFNTYNT